MSNNTLIASSVASSQISSTRTPYTDECIANFKEEARQTKKKDKIKLSFALDEIAIREGFLNWSQLMRKTNQLKNNDYIKKLFIPVKSLNTQEFDGLVLLEIDKLLINQIKEVHDKYINSGPLKITWDDYHDVKEYRKKLITSATPDDQLLPKTKFSILNFSHLDSIKIAPHNTHSFEIVLNYTKTDNTQSHVSSVLGLYNRHHFFEEVKRSGEFLFKNDRFNITENCFSAFSDIFKPITFLRNDPRLKYLTEKGCLFFEAVNSKTKETEYYCYINNYNETESLFISFDTGKARFLGNHLSNENELIVFKSITQIIDYVFKIVLKDVPYFCHFVKPFLDEISISVENIKDKEQKELDDVIVDLQLIALAKKIYIQKLLDYCCSLSKRDQLKFVKSQVDLNSNIFKKIETEISNFVDESINEAYGRLKK